MGPGKVFQIGFNKCGTRTLHRFFELNGFRAVHWDRGRLARMMFRNLADGDSLIKGYGQFDAFSDMEFVTREFAFEGYKLFPLLAGEFPDALFLLNTRDREEWVRSRLAHRDGAYARTWKTLLSVDDNETLANHWRAEWDRHHERVERFFAGGRLRFLKFDIERDPPELIARQFPHRHFERSAYRVRGRTRPSDAAAQQHSSEKRRPPHAPVHAAADHRLPGD